MSPGVLAAARRLDAYTVAGGPERDRQAALAAASAMAVRNDRVGPSAPPFRYAAALDSSRDLDCLAAAVYYEARGETAAGQAAVAQVVLNRTRHPAFPKTVCGVVYQGVASGGCQFSFVCNGSMRRDREPNAWTRARQVAAKALSGYVMTDVGQAVNFHAARVGTPWGMGMIRVAQVGSHVFYRFGRGGVRGGAYTGEDDHAPTPEQVSRPVYAGAGSEPRADGAQPVTLASASQAAASALSQAAQAPAPAKPAEGAKVEATAAGS
jgi:hypothetical protein